MKNKNYKLIGMSAGIVLLLVLSMWSALAANPTVTDTNSLDLVNKGLIVTADQDITPVKLTVNADVGNTLTVTVTDAKDQDIKWLSPDKPGKDKYNPKESVTLSGKPSYQNEVGTYDVTVTVADNKGATATLKFKATVVKPLGIDTSTVTIALPGKTAKMEDKLEVSPGDTVTITSTYKNNFNGNVLENMFGSIITTATSVLGGQADFVKYSSMKWSVKPGESVENKIQFTVPKTITVDPKDPTFKVNVNVVDEIAAGQPQYTDSISLTFNVVQKVKNAFIEENSLKFFNGDDTFTCTKATILSLNLVNNGKYDIASEIIVTNQKASESDIDQTTGKLKTTSIIKGYYKEEDKNKKIKPGEKLLVSVPVDMSGLSGSHTLYVYIVSPWFFDEGKNIYFFADEKTIAVKNVGSCLKTDAVQNALIIAKNAPAEKLVDLFSKGADGKYVFIDEDKDYEKTLTFSVAKDKDGKELQTNTDLISCKVNADGHTVSCAKPAANKEGTSDVTLKMDESVSKSSLTEKATVKVAPILRLSVVDVNGKTPSDLAVSGLTVAPLDSLTIKYKVANALDEKLVNGKVSLKDVKFNFVTQQGFNLKNKEESAVKTFKVDIPTTAVDGKYDFTFLSEAVTDLDNKVHQDSFTFSLTVKQKADLQVSVSAKESTIACKSDNPVDVKIVNIGKVEKKGEISVKEGEKVHDKSSFKVGPAGGSSTTTFTLPVTSAGKHTYTVTVDYDFDVESVAGNSVVKTIDITKEGCLDKTSALPKEKSLVTAEGVKTVFSVKTSKPGFDNSVKWFVNDQEVLTGLALEFTPAKTATYTIKAKLNGEETDVWTLKVSNIPVATLVKTNIKGSETKEQLAAFDGFSVESVTSNVGKIEFNQKVDLTKVLDLDKAITIVDGSIGVDSVNFPDLNKPAKITVYKSFTNPVILKTDEKGQSVPCTTCTVVTNANNLFVFTVNGFSTYKVIEKQSVGIELSTIATIENVELGNATSFTFTVKNTGSMDSLTNVKLDLSGIAAKYKAKVTDDVDGTILAQKTDTVKVEFTVPKDEEGGKHEMGSVKVTSTEVAAGMAQKVFLSPKSYLRIDSVQVKGKESGKFSLSEPTEFKVEVVNDFTVDLSDVFVTVKVLDVDNDNIEVESDSQDIDTGDSNDFKVDVDLSKEVVDEESYDVEITVEGEDENGATQKMTLTKSINVNREKHKVVVKQASVSEEELSCTRATTVRVELENQGKNNENDVVVKVKNSALKLDVKKEKIELDKFSGDDNDYVAVLAVDAANAVAGSYPLSVEVYLEGALVDTKTVNLNVRDCGAVTGASIAKGQQTFVSNEEAKVQSVALQQQLQTKVQADAQKVVKGSFREQESYILLLGVLTILVFIALVLALAVVVIKKK